MISIASIPVWRMTISHSSCFDYGTYTKPRKDAEQSFQDSYMMPFPKKSVSNKSFWCSYTLVYIKVAYNIL